MAVTATTSQIIAAATTVRAVVRAAALPGNVEGHVADARALFEKARQVYINETRTARQITAAGANFAALVGTPRNIADGEVFTVAGAEDTTDDVLETAKGSAPAAGNVFQRVGSAIQYVGASKGDVAGLSALLTY